MDVMFWVWLGIVAITALAEFLTMDMTSIWFTLGAVPSLVMAAIGGVRWEIQLAVFVVLSAVLLLSLRRFTKKLLLKHADEKTNLDALVGKKYKLTEAITQEGAGALKINGVVWTAISDTDIAKDAKVEIVKVDGNKLVVKRVKEEEK